MCVPPYQLRGGLTVDGVRVHRTGHAIGEGVRGLKPASLKREGVRARAFVRRRSGEGVRGEVERRPVDIPARICTIAGA